MWHWWLRHRVESAATTDPATKYQAGLVLDSNIKAVADLLKEQSRPFEMRISGDCMRPLLMPGDLVTVAPVGRIFPGDIIVFQAGQGRMTAHRLLGRTITPRGMRWMTKPDNVAAIDGLLASDQILGRLTHNISQDCVIETQVSQRLTCVALLIKNSFAAAMRKFRRH